MKRTFVLVTAVVAALSAAAVAVGHGLDSAKSVKEVSGTFTATTVARTSSHTCTTADGKTIVTTDGTYTGTASGDPTLTGNATIRAHSAVNTTDGVGLVSGTLRIGTSGGDTETRFDAVVKGTSLAGLASGRVHNPSAKLVANLSSDFGPATGFANGKLGGTSGGTAVEIGPGSCVRSSTTHETSRANGTVTASSATSITVAGLTCAVPVSLQSLVAPLTVGTRAEISCSVSGGVNTLVKANARHK